MFKYRSWLKVVSLYVKTQTFWFYSQSRNTSPETSVEEKRSIICRIMTAWCHRVKFVLWRRAEWFRPSAPLTLHLIYIYISRCLMCPCTCSCSAEYQSHSYWQKDPRISKSQSYQKNIEYYENKVKLLSQISLSLGKSQFGPILIQQHPVILLLNS